MTRWLTNVAVLNMDAEHQAIERQPVPLGEEQDGTGSDHRALKQGSEQPASELVGAGPPFDLADAGIVRHSVYVSADEVVFVFEGHEVEWIVDRLIDEPFHYELHRALERWREIVDGPPRVARERFGWQLDEGESVATSASERGKSWA